MLYMNKPTHIFCCLAFFIATIANAQPEETARVLRDTLGERLVTLHSPLFEETYRFEVGTHHFSVKRKKILDSLFYRTPDEVLHFFMVDTAEQEIYQGAPAMRKIPIPVNSFFLDTLFDPDTGKILAVDTIRSVVVQSRFLFTIPSVNDFFDRMKWMDRFEALHPEYKVSVFKHSGSGPFMHLGDYGIRDAVAHLVAYMFKRETDDWFILNFYCPDARFKEPDIKIVMHYDPS